MGRQPPLRPDQRVGPSSPPPVMTDVDGAVVGCGPVGNALAILLAQHGRTVTALERWPEPYALTRAVHFDHEAGRILQACGIGDDLRKVSEPAEVYEWRNGTGTTLLRFGHRGDEIGRAHVGTPVTNAPLVCRIQLAQ